ncbi:acetate--CoA ligase family protein [Microbaculum marinum]|uniref:Acetate--CoA ligase family protein n=1 Tax=Microbaculum marinum TaxID=1764581 RepID=A0AAW9RMV2_9HYPH
MKPTALYTHRLDPLLRPSSLAIVGASARPGSVGNMLIRHLRLGGYPGALWGVNPNYPEIDGVPCYASLQDLPAAPEHVVFGIGDDRLEQELAKAIELGARAATIFSPLSLAGDDTLKDRVRARAREAGMVLCGANCMGFYNFHAGLWVCGFETHPRHRPGGTVLLTHSGALFTALVDSEERIDYGLAVSPGQELTTTIADYMDFALDQPWTRVIGLFMETARDPDGFEAALRKANEKNVPVVALKVGRTEVSARLAVTHSGAITGDHAAYSALFERYGVGQVRTVEELAASLMVLEAARDIGPGGIVSSHDSGGERGLMIDLCHDEGVRLAEPGAATIERLTDVLDHGLEPVNPLDHWGSGRNFPYDFEESFKALMRDPDTAMGALVLDRTVDGRVQPINIRLVAETFAETGKPSFVVATHQGSGTDPEAVRATRAGTPVMDGLASFVAAARVAFDWRDFKARPPMRIAPPDPQSVETWKTRLAGGEPLEEAEALAMLADFGIPTAPCEIAEDEAAAVAAADRIGYPVALKTATPGIAHKSDVGGVTLGHATEDALRGAYRDMAGRLGPRAMIATMIPGPKVELILGMTRDATLGPVVLIGFGGIHAEVLKDVVFARPPFDETEARRLIDRLRLRSLLDGVRGAPPSDLDALATTAARFSVLAAALGDAVESIDVNPLLALPAGCAAVDALVVARRCIDTAQ